MATQQFDVFVEHTSTFTRLNLVVFSGTVYNLLHAAGEYMAVVLSETDNVIHSEALDTIFNVKAILFVVFKEDVDFIHTAKQVVQVAHYILIRTDQKYAKVVRLFRL